jgi:site-specific recombinase XerD
MRHAGDDRHSRRMRGLIVMLWRAGLRIHEALALAETDLNERRGSLLIRHGKRDRRREVGTDPWARSVLDDWTSTHTAFPPGPLFYVIDGPTRGRAWSATTVRAELRHLAVEARVRQRFAPHQLRHAHAVELLHKRISLPLTQRQLGHAYLSTTATYLEGISSEKDHRRHQPPEGPDDARQRRARAPTSARSAGALRRSRHR